jgi:hypothetical protein
LRLRGQHGERCAEHVIEVQSFRAHGHGPGFEARELQQAVDLRMEIADCLFDLGGGVGHQLRRRLLPRGAVADSVLSLSLGF